MRQRARCVLCAAIRPLTAIAALLLGAACAAPAGQPPGPVDGQDFLARQSADDIRVFSLNVGMGTFLPDAPALRTRGIRTRPERLARVTRAVAPDILCLQEIHANGAPAVGRRLDSILPLPLDARWNTHQVRDNVIASRFPIIATAGHVEEYKRGTPRGEAIAVTMVPTTGGPRALLVICAHFESRGTPADIAARLRHAEHITGWLHDSLASVGIDTPLRQTPLVVLGDLNAYDTDPAAHVATLLAGAPPAGRGAQDKWHDELPLLTDASPLHNARGPERYTWRNDTQKFDPGALDRILFNASVLDRAHAFVLNTGTMTPAELQQAGLRRDDVLLDIERRMHDHFPLVADLRFR
jgi:endonuclease/exonuclease/phosphatase family metal-dependent hydrolase